MTRCLTIDLHSAMPVGPEQKKSNRRLALILATVAAVFFAGFMLRVALFGH